LATNERIDFSKSKSGQNAVKGPLYYVSEDQDVAFEQRRRKYNQYWKWYLGKHWIFEGKEGESQLTVNFVRAFVDKVSFALIGNGLEFNLPKVNESLGEKALIKAWGSDSFRGLRLYELVQEGGVTGDSWLKIWFDEVSQKITLNVVDGRLVDVVWSPGDRERLIWVKIEFPIYEFNTETGERVRRKYKEIFYEDKIELYLDDELKESLENPIMEIPLVHISNLPISGVFWGLSDMINLIDLNLEYNEKISDVSDTIAYYGAPITVIKGVSFKNVIRSAGRVWSNIPTDGDVKFLNLAGNLSSSIKYLELLKKSLHEMSNVPEATLGQMQPISNTSAAALHVQYMPLVERMKLKRLTYGRGLERTNRLILKILETKKKIPKLKDGDDFEAYDTSVVFKDPLPKDRITLLQELEMELSLGLIDREGALSRLGIKNISELLARIDKEHKTQLEQEASISGRGGTFADMFKGKVGA